jgi:hypothetical protein
MCPARVSDRVPPLFTAPDARTSMRNSRHTETRLRENSSDAACPLQRTRARRMSRCARCANALSRGANAMFAERSALLLTLSRHVDPGDTRATNKWTPANGIFRRASRSRSEGATRSPSPEGRGGQGVRTTTSPGDNGSPAVRTSTSPGANGSPAVRTTPSPDASGGPAVRMGAPAADLRHLSRGKWTRAM